MSHLNERCWLVIPAAGSGSRMQLNQPKQYSELLGEPMLAQVLKPFLGCDFIDGITVALAENDAQYKAIDALNQPKVSLCVGGASRAESVLACLRAVSAAKPNDWVMVHDAARPCVTAAQIEALYNTLKVTKHGGLWAVPQPNTLKRVANNTVLETVDRSDIWCAQTPQMFRVGELSSALTEALQSQLTITDEASAIEISGLPVQIVPGHSQNLKVTYPEDAALAAYYLQGSVE